MAKAIVNWFGDQVAKVYKSKAQKGVETIAYEVRHRARQNLRNGGHIDTRFLYDGVYVATPTTTTPIPPNGTYTSLKGNGQVRRQNGEVVQVRDGAFVGAAASYAVFVEILDPFLWPAVEEMKGAPAEKLMTGLFRD